MSERRDIGTLGCRNIATVVGSDFPTAKLWQKGGDMRVCRKVSFGVVPCRTGIWCYKNLSTLTLSPDIESLKVVNVSTFRISLWADLYRLVK